MLTLKKMPKSLSLSLYLSFCLSLQDILRTDRKEGGQLRERLMRYPISFQDRANNHARSYICKHARRMSLNK